MLRSPPSVKLYTPPLRVEQVFKSINISSFRSAIAEGARMMRRAFVVGFERASRHPLAHKYASSWFSTQNTCLLTVRLQRRQGVNGAPTKACKTTNSPSCRQMVSRPRWAGALQGLVLRVGGGLVCVLVLP